jgi:hypothetical protein
MAEIIETPLPDNFYHADGWLGSILKYYADERQYLPRGVLEGPMALLTESIQYVVDVYGNFPKSTYSFFRQVVNPLWDAGEYEKNVYEALLPPYDNPNDPDLTVIAKKLFDIRRLFEKDEEFYKDKFANEIQQIDQGASDEEKFEHYAESVKMITKIHVVQVAKMIMARR